MYRPILENQWRSLCAAFAQEYQRLSSGEDMLKSFGDWYATRIRRWGSAGYSEGLILEQQENEAFSRDLRKAMAEFHFKRVDSAPAKPVWFGPVVGIGVGLVAGLGLTLLKWGTVKSVISGIVLCGVVTVVLMKKTEAGQKANQDQTRNDYRGQVEAHLQKLMAVCDQYEVD